MGYSAGHTQAKEHDKLFIRQVSEGCARVSTRAVRNLESEDVVHSAIII